LPRPDGQILTCLPAFGNSKAADANHLGVASLYSIWKGPNGEDLLTMSFLLRPASEYVMDHGHHRQPYFIEEAGFDAWMAPGTRDAKDSLAVLREHADEPPLEYKVARQMAASWKSRQKARLSERDKQLAAIEETGPLGV
jgi:putative SOS response-associated peptidase YedK